jgi:hypothetical protein
MADYIELRGVRTWYDECGHGDPVALHLTPLAQGYGVRVHGMRHDGQRPARRHIRVPAYRRSAL